MGQTISVYIPDEEELLAPHEKVLDGIIRINGAIRLINLSLSNFYEALRIDRNVIKKIEIDGFEFELVKLKRGASLCINGIPAEQLKYFERFRSSKHIFELLSLLKEPSFVQDLYLKINQI